ncbi:MAG: alpha/beta hydrolase [Rhodospirillaceae bacterium]|jgi:pimeloyl-[acyl-carrier protein] methyl ester esterase|nr:alpha/beta hydrolase [Rhodospirillaceae bacterium]
MTPVLLLVHGWGFDITFWRPLQKALDGIECVTLDLFKQLNYPPLQKGQPIIAIGHSYGFFWLLKNKPVDWQVLVSINGFSKFVRDSDFPYGIEPYILNRMISRFSIDPKTVYQDFMIRCGAIESKWHLQNSKALMDGLNNLLCWDMRSKITSNELLVLAGNTDPIVSKEMTMASFIKTNIHWHQSGHLLPLQDPNWCAMFLKQLCKKYQ